MDNILQDQKAFNELTSFLDELGEIKCKFCGEEKGYSKTLVDANGKKISALSNKDSIYICNCKEGKEFWVDGCMNILMIGVKIDELNALKDKG